MTFLQQRAIIYHMNNYSKPWLIFRISVMCLGFVAVIYTMNNLSSEAVGKSDIGQMVTGKGAPKNSLGETQWKWCEAEIKKLKLINIKNLKNSLNFIKDKENWVLKENGAKTRLNKAKLENWLKSSCLQKIYAIKSETTPRRDFQFNVEFDNGKGIQLEFSEAGSIMIWKGNLYSAEGFLDSIKELQKKFQ